ncbi:hypothetical protein GLW05_08495 [Pontibacillus yanchengensis]|uniref:SLH domain-containing protein n=1 Tax=Pontibacillus yanchengensis TaxID=462910 RepID=A0A6I4ZTR7_9BACI|nr:S-layer homology domain-containing protein [Pontibacillus yanchengensis]MYL33635.1 hypothetical protein [Pontibacillus yanchengensis]
MSSRLIKLFSHISFLSFEGPALALAYEHGVTKGVKEGVFAPDQELNRVQMAFMLMRAYESVSDEKVTVSDEKVFKDKGAFLFGLMTKY